MAPLETEELGQFPEVVVYAAGLDFLKERGVMYAEFLKGKVEKEGLITEPSKDRPAKRHKPVRGHPFGSGGKSHNYPTRVSSSVPVTKQSIAMNDPLIGRSLMVRWPDDGIFYEAVIMAYDPIKGEHALVYDRNTPKQTSEWVNLKQASLKHYFL
ncbi:hypothetical protein Vadar_003427 [Vaccinium darrowii]|uniref:Uncharacterized protein n=1 Tax=Vaccinium darrowii TaxID=229202 RepID=A0ACB7XF42_9ERIC|nr:hypothetical protein Vadar_003427 [Vaccinium darrowii]